MIALGIYAFVLLIIGIMSALITYFALLYRDPHDLVIVVLIAYYVAVTVVLFGTIALLDFSAF